jgi:hypothetical protein
MTEVPSEVAKIGFAFVSSPGTTLDDATGEIHFDGRRLAWNCADRLSRPRTKGWACLIKPDGCIDPPVIVFALD